MGNCAGVGGGGRTRTSTSRSGGIDDDETEEEQVQEMIKVVTSTGGVMELYAPITAGSVTNEFPGHRLFCGGRPLLPTDNLRVGRLYHLLPPILPDSGGAFMVTSSSPAATPYRMSSSFACDSKKRSISGGGYYYKQCTNPYANQLGQFKSTYLGTTTTTTRGSSVGGDVRSRCNSNSSRSSSGVWKVRLVINPEHLSEILSQEARTEELIESVRTVAKCSTDTGGWGGGSRKNSYSGRCSW